MPLDVDSSISAKSPRYRHPGRAKDVEDEYLASLPAHVNTVREGLLDFDRFLGLEAAMLVVGDEKSDECDEDCIPLNAYKTDGLKASQRAREREFVEDACRFAVGAQKLESLFARNGEWRTLFRDVAKSRMDDAQYFSSHRPSTIACKENERWDIDLDPSQSSLKNPNPDLYFGFPISIAEHHNFSRFRHDLSLKNFTIDTLLQLARKGLRSVPVSSSLNSATRLKRDGREPQAPLLCFPWCITQLEEVGAKGDFEEIDNSALETSHKASAAATAALTIFETLARFADVKLDSQHIPPVITITSVRADATVWLAYSEIIDDKYREHKMINVWNGSISKIWDAIQFCRILDNLFFWSQNILRPQVSQYIDKWMLHYTPEVDNLHFRLEKDLETAEIVHKIQDRLNSLGISPNSRLPDLIEQAVILQEATRLNLRKAEPPTRNSLDPHIQYEMRPSEKLPSYLAGSYEKSTNKDSTATKDTFGQRFTSSKPSTPIDFTLAGISSEGPWMNELVSKLESQNSFNTDEKRQNQTHFSYPYKFKASDFEYDKRRFYLPSLESTKVDPNRPAPFKNLPSGKNSNNQPRSTTTSVTTPNPFTAKSFDLSFRIKYWWCSMSVEAPLPQARPEPEPLFTFHTELVSSSREYETERTVRFEPANRKKSRSQLAEIPKAPLSRIKIPWKDNKFIVVKLPPVMPI